MNISPARQTLRNSGMSFRSKPGQQTPPDSTPKDGLVMGSWAKKLAPAMTLAMMLSACAPHDGAPAPTPEPTAVEQPIPAPKAADPAPQVSIERPDVIQEFPVHGAGEMQYNFSSRDVEILSRNSVTADQLAPDAPHLTALGVDSYQGTKTYPEGADSFHMLTGGFKECTDMSSEGQCREVKDNFIGYKHLSCTYKDEATGEKVRVLQRSTVHMRTPEMDKYVCGGHRLEHDAEWNTYSPKQTDKMGNPLYLNPANIVEMTPIPQ